MVNARAAQVRTNLVDDVAVALVTLMILAAIVLTVLAASERQDTSPEIPAPASSGPTRPQPAFQPWA